jgi:hypothetical protein
MKQELKDRINKVEKEVSEIKKLIEKEKDKEERLWDIEKICKGILNYPDYNNLICKLKCVAEYCNNLDERQPTPFAKTFKKFYPAWSPQYEKVVTDGNVLFLASPYFHNGETLYRLINENPDFFESLLKPEEE